MRVDAQSKSDVVDGVGLEEFFGIDVPGIENLASERKNRLELLVASALCRTAGRVAFHDEQFAARRIVGFAVGELARQHRDGRTLLLFILDALSLTVLSLGDEVLGKLPALLDVVVEPEFELALYKSGYEPECVPARELFLGLSLELRVERLR